jgi:hypothetical protein
VVGSAAVEEEAEEASIVLAGEERRISISISECDWGKEDAGVGYVIANCYKNRNRSRNWGMAKIEIDIEIGGWQALDVECDEGDERVVSEERRNCRKDCMVRKRWDCRGIKNPHYAFIG